MQRSIVQLILFMSVAAYAEEPDVRHDGDVFRVWAFSDAHVFSDLYLREKTLKKLNPEGDLLPHESGIVLRRDARESLGDAIVQTELDPTFRWDIAIGAGDFSGSHNIPTAREGKEVVRQLGRLTRHRRADIYTVSGNHDASPDNYWFRTWLDPLGHHAEYSGVRNSERPFAVEGTWERYSFRVGNILFLMLSDRNDFEPPVGRIRNGSADGGHPAGAVTADTFAWWKAKVLAEPESSIIITVHHHVLKQTTVGSGDWEGFPDRYPFPTGFGDRRYHGYYPGDGEHNKGAGYLYWLVDDSRVPIKAIPNAGVFEAFLEQHPGIIDIWIGGHTHTEPTDSKNGRSHIGTKWGVNFVNVAALSVHHGGDHSLPMSRHFTFKNGSAEVTVQCYLHTDHFAERGWYEPAARTIQLGAEFRSVRKMIKSEM